MKKNQNKTITKIGVTVLLIACISIGLSATLYFLNTKIANGSEISTDTVNDSTSTGTVNNDQKIFNHIRVPKPKINDLIHDSINKKNNNEKIFNHVRVPNPKINDLIRDSINKKNNNYDTNKVITNSTSTTNNSVSSSTPKTGDNDTTIAYLFLTGLVLLAIAVFIYDYIKEKKEKEKRDRVS